MVKIRLVLVAVLATSSLLIVVLLNQRGLSTQLKTRAAQGSALAFPTAEGFGAATIGGRGGQVIEITNLNDSGTGSLRNCIDAVGPRYCIFTVGGVITVNSPLLIKEPYITIVGQTASGEGITVTQKNGTDVFTVKTHDVVFRYLTVRAGPGGENHGMQIAANDSNNVFNIIVDHSTFSWGVDSNIETWYRVQNATIQWSIISEGLNNSTHSKGAHSKGLMIGGYAGGNSKNTSGSENISILRNLLAHNADRNPLMQLCGTAQVVNNTTYNAQYTFSHQQDNCAVAAVNHINWVGNYHKKGPNSESNSDLKVIPADSGVYANQSKVYVSGNIGPSRNNNNLPESDWVDSGSRKFIVNVPAEAPLVTVTDALSAYQQVINHAGNSQGLDCNGAYYARRDGIDSRVVSDVLNGTGKIIDDPSEVGGITIKSSVTSCIDSDHDGMSDAWENHYFGNLDQGGSQNSSSDKDADGYTDLEEYLNGTTPVVGITGGLSPTLTPTSGIGPSPTSQASPTPSSTPTLPPITILPTERPTLTPPIANDTPTLIPTATKIPTPTLPPPLPTKIPTPTPPILPNNPMQISTIYYYWVGRTASVHLKVVNKLTGRPVSKALVTYSVVNNKTGKTYRTNGYTDENGLENHTIYKLPWGCYSTRVASLKKESWIWDGIVPSNGLCF